MKFVLKLHIIQTIFLKSPNNLRKWSDPIGCYLQWVSVDWQRSGADDGFEPLKRSSHNTVLSHSHSNNNRF